MAVTSMSHRDRIWRPGIWSIGNSRRYPPGTMWLELEFQGLRAQTVHSCAPFTIGRESEEEGRRTQGPNPGRPIANSVWS